MPTHSFTMDMNVKPTVTEASADSLNERPKLMSVRFGKKSQSVQLPLPLA